MRFVPMPADRPPSSRVAVFCLIAMLASPAAAAAASPSLSPASTDATRTTIRRQALVDAREEIRLRVERLRARGAVDLAGDTVSAGAVAALYEARGFQPAWRDTDRALAVLRGAESMRSDGLTPADYHARAIRKFTSSPPRTPADTATLDLLLTSAVHRMVRDLRQGRADRSRLWSSGSVAEQTGTRVGVDLLAAVVGAADPEAAIDGLRPQHAIYSGMREALARYRALRDSGGWPTLPAGPTMRRDSAAGPVALLRGRLAIEGYIEDAGMPGPSTFDPPLEAAVRAFQHTHGLNEDGIVGPVTRAALNVPVQHRIDAIRVNMERARWVLPGLSDRFVAANIAGQKVYFVDRGDVVFETRAVVGTLYRRTPVFADTMRYVVLNPTWTVPRSINGEVLAGVRSDPDWLETRRMVIIDRAENRIDPADIDFDAYTADTFPWVFRQLPGPRNPLGRIKFMFPNPYDVYLHDTPARAEFERELRTFSHGCIRVEDPLRLAELVLAGQVGTDQASLTGIVAAGTTRTIRLEQPVPVLLLYWTAAADLHGELHFYPDVYGRDTAVLRALDGPDAR